MKEVSDKQKNNSKKFLIQKLEKDLENLRIKNEEEIKIFKTNQLILEHLIKNAYLYGTLDTKNYFGYEVKNCDWCKTSFVDNGRTKNQRFCRTSCRVASWRIDNRNDKGGKKRVKYIRGK